MYESAQRRPMNAWERQFYRQLSHAAPGADELPSAFGPSGDPDHRHAALQAALRRALVESERACSD
jgi:hypothetical protein